MNINRILLILTVAICLLLFSSSNIYSQIANTTFERLITKDGLSQSTVNYIIQDKQGFMWFATYGGINKYDGYTFKVYKNVATNKNSLSNNGSIFLYEDRAGYIWILNNASDGLDKFDPVNESFIRYKHNPNDSTSISSDEVNHVMQDKSGNIWVCTKNALDLVINEKKGTKTFTSFKRFYSLSHTVSFLKSYEDRNGKLLLFADYLYYFDRKACKFTRTIKLPTVYYISSICEDKSGNLYLGTNEKGIVKLSYNKRNQSYEYTKLNKINVTPDARNYTIIDNQDRIWIGTDSKGLFQYDTKEDRLLNFLNDKTDITSISDNTIESLFVDRSGVLWIGTFSQGLCKSNLYKKDFFHFKSVPGNKNSLSGDAISSIHSTVPGELWVGADLDGGVNRFIFDHDKVQQVIYYKHDPNDNNTIGNNTVLCLVQRKNGDVWEGSANGYVSKIIPEKPGSNKHPIIKTYRFDAWTFSIYEDKQGTLWGGTWRQGLWRYDDKTDKFIFYLNDPGNPLSLCDNIVWTITEDNSGNIWIGGHGRGLSILPAKEKTGLTSEFINFKHEEEKVNSLSDNTIHVIFQDHIGTIWIGTSCGLNKVQIKDNNFKDINSNSKIEFHAYHMKDGLPSEDIIGILEDDKDNLWLSTSNGMSKFNIKKDSFTNYDETDGLQGDEFRHNAYFKDQNGKMYFGGFNGINAFYPDSIKPNPFLPKVVFTDIKLFNKSVQIGEKINGDIIISKSINYTSEIILSHENNVFTIVFAALQYTCPEKNHYAFILEGFEKNWNYVGNKREATYTNLEPGKYTLMVKAASNDGVWNEKGISLKIIILPPWWKTWWFKAILLLCVLTCFTYLLIKFINKIKHQANQTILNERNQLKTLINNLPDRVLIKDTKLRFLIINESSAKFFGIKSEADFINKTDYDFHPKEQADNFFKEEQEILSTGVPILNQEGKRYKNGQEYIVSTTKCPIKNAKGETLGLVCIIRDITTQKMAELEIIKQSEELQRYNETLSEANVLLEERQQQIEEQSEELRVRSENLLDANELLLEKQKLIQQQSEELITTNEQLSILNATKDKLFSIIGHDLRNPFNVIIGFSELLIKGFGRLRNEKIKKFHNLIQIAALNGNNLLENLLQWSRAQTGRILFEPGKLNFNAIAEETLNLLTGNAQRKNISIHKEIDPGLMIFADGNMVKTILRNLISNAIKFTKEKGSIILKSEINDGMVQITIVDSGIGIPEENLRKLFCVDTTVTTKGTSNEAGTGLGLVICKEFVEKNKGKIWVNSEEGKGSKFVFTLPKV